MLNPVAVERKRGIDVEPGDVATGLYALEIINGGKVYRGRFVVGLVDSEI